MNALLLLKNEKKNKLTHIYILEMNIQNKIIFFKVTLFFLAAVFLRDELNSFFTHDRCSKNFHEKTDNERGKKYK